MMKRRLKSNSRGIESSEMTTSRDQEDVEWEMRPGGMLVQRRTDHSDSPAPNFLLRVTYGAARYQISVSSQATFGELKKLLTAETGLQPADQMIIFRGKERENGDFLDFCGVKDRSKVIVMEDPSSRERKLVEMRRNAKIQTAHRKINDVSMEIDRLAEQVSAIEKSIANGKKVAEVQITTLIEMLMRQAVKLDSIPAEGDASTQKSSQGRRVQKCVETLDVLKVSNAGIKSVIVTTKWETFGFPSPSPPPPPPTTATTTTTHWEFFD